MLHVTNTYAGATTGFIEMALAAILGAIALLFSLLGTRSQYTGD
jgi:hypothetical protein